MTQEEFHKLYRQYCEVLSRTETHLTTRYALVNRLLIAAWCRETAHPDSQKDWRPENPALGQCAVSSLVTHDILGGGILRCVVEGYGSHYANLISIGEDAMQLDYTGGQFPLGVEIPPMSPVSRDHLLHSARAIQAGTPERYVMLRERIAQVMRDYIAKHANNG